MFCLFQYRVRPGEKCGFTTKSTKVTKRIFPIPSRDARCEDIHSGRRPSAGSDHTKPACLGRFSSFRSFCVFVPFVAIPGKDPAAAFCKRLFCLSIFSIHIDAQDAQDYFRKRPASIPEHPQIRTRSSPESASRAVASRPGYPVHPVHPCSIYGRSRWICPVVGVGCAQRPDSQSASRAAASRPVNPVYQYSLMQHTGLTEPVPTADSHELPLFHSRMIRTVVAGRGPANRDLHLPLRRLRLTGSNKKWNYPALPPYLTPLKAIC